MRLMRALRRASLSGFSWRCTEANYLMSGAAIEGIVVGAWVESDSMEATAREPIPGKSVRRDAARGTREVERYLSQAASRD